MPLPADSTHSRRPAQALASKGPAARSCSSRYATLCPARLFSPGPVACAFLLVSDGVPFPKTPVPLVTICRSEPVRIVFTPTKTLSIPCQSDLFLEPFSSSNQPAREVGERMGGGSVTPRDGGRRRPRRGACWRTSPRRARSRSRTPACRPRPRRPSSPTR